MLKIYNENASSVFNDSDSDSDSDSDNLFSNLTLVAGIASCFANTLHEAYFISELTMDMSKHLKSTTPPSINAMDAGGTNGKGSSSSTQPAQSAKQLECIWRERWERPAKNQNYIYSLTIDIHRKWGTEIPPEIANQIQYQHQLSIANKLEVEKVKFEREQKRLLFKLQVEHEQE